MTQADDGTGLSYLLGFDPLHRLSDDEKISYLKERLERMVLESTRYARVRASGEPTAEGRRIDTNLGLMTLICCAIEALGHFLEGRISSGNRCETCEQLSDPQGGRADFRAFVKRYMESFDPFSAVLYDEYRSALAHGFAIPTGGIIWELDVPFKHGNVSDPHALGFGSFIDEFNRGTDRYFDEVRDDQDLREKFLRRWEHVHAFWIDQARRRDTSWGKP